MSNWHPSLFEKEGRKLGFDEEYLNATVSYGRDLTAKGFPVVFSLGHLAHLTDTSYDSLRMVIKRDVDPYRKFKIRKRSGGYRQIVVPEFYLLKVQKWVHKHILSRCQFHPCSYAYIKERNPKGNASVHCGADWLVKIDIQRFFESISERQVYHLFKGIGYTDLLSFELARICTRATWNRRKGKSKRWSNGYPSYEFYNSNIVGHLPQGAPTSPLLSNLVLLQLDNEITSISRKYNCSYTRYSDDLTFSGRLDRDRAKTLIADVSQVLSECGFRRHVRKTHVIPPGARKIVTGLVVNDSVPRVAKEFRDGIENHLYYATKFGVKDHCSRIGFKSLIGFKNHLLGKIMHVRSIDFVLGQRYLTLYNDVEWPEGI